MSKNDQYEYPEGSSADKKYGIMSKDGRTESLIPPFLRDPKSLAMAFGVGILFYLVTHLFSYLLSSRSDDVEAKEIAKKSDKQIEEIAAKIQNDKNNTATKLSSFSNKVDTIINDSQDNAKHLRENDQKIEDVKEQVKTIASSLDKINASIENLSSRIEAIKAVKPQVKAKKVVRRAAPVVLEKYDIVAMIRGRAWVQSIKGVYLTIKVGDMLPTYGTILNIDEVHGIVNTSSGREIRYEKSN